MGEGVGFAVEENSRMVILLDKMATPSDEEFQIGRCFDLHSSACGKATLAELSNGKTETIFEERELPAYTGDMITDKADLVAGLKTIRARRYAVSKQEELEGLRAVATAINKPDGDLFGTLDVFGPPYPPPRDEETAKRLQSVVAEVESFLASEAQN